MNHSCWKKKVRGKEEGQDASFSCGHSPPPHHPSQSVSNSELKEWPVNRFLRYALHSGPRERSRFTLCWNRPKRVVTRVTERPTSYGAVAPRPVLTGGPSGASIREEPLLVFEERNRAPAGPEAACGCHSQPPSSSSSSVCVCVYRVWFARGDVG